MKHHVEYLLNEDLDNLSVDFLLNSIEMPLMRIRVEKIKEMGIDFPQNFRFLEVLEHHEGMIQKEFAARFQINQSTVTRSLNALEKQGFIKRVILEGNRKNKVIYLTDDGKNLLKVIHNFDKQLEEKMINNFSEDDVSKFKELCVLMIKNINDFSH